MIRKIINIDEDKCNGCGLCATACHEGAIEMVDGKAKLMREDFCDGLGDCLPACPTGAITFEEREAPAYDAAAVKKAQEESPEPRHGCPGSRPTTLNHVDETNQGVHSTHRHGCPGSRPATLNHVDETNQGEHSTHRHGCPGSRPATLNQVDEVTKQAPSPVPTSRLAQWPCQIKLVPTQAPYFEGAKLLVAADCTAYAYANIHEEFMKGKVTIIGCPKLDDIDYSEKLTEIIRLNDIKEVTILRMEVPCCGGLEMATKNALQASGKFIPWQIVTISCDGHILA